MNTIVKEYSIIELRGLLAKRYIQVDNRYITKKQLLELLEEIKDVK